MGPLPRRPTSYLAAGDRGAVPDPLGVRARAGAGATWVRGGATGRPGGPPGRAPKSGGGVSGWGPGAGPGEPARGRKEGGRQGLRHAGRGGGRAAGRGTIALRLPGAGYNPTPGND